MKIDLGTLQTILWVGDLVVIGLVTLTGFASHGELLEAGWRMLTTFIPLAFAWLVVGLPGGLFTVSQALRPNQLWRPLWAMVAAGPLAVLLRSFFLEMRPILPNFAWIITGVSAAAILVWRLVFLLVFKGRSD